ncbi:MAG: hypothetical protein JWO30_4908 [Fibrobacteres bacterium]|nr:hypothetical protein [Fibrobacterota bacterium]
MMNRSLPISIFLAILGTIPSLATAQVYTEENKGTIVVPFSGWNMNANGNFESFVVPQSSFPSGFNMADIIDVTVTIDADPLSGKPAKVVPLYRMKYETAGTLHGGFFYTVCVPPNIGGNCQFFMTRGTSSSTFFTNSSYDDPVARRGYVQIDYKTGALPAPSGVNEYYYPINNWNMETTGRGSHVKTVDLPNIDISKIANVSVTILSDPNAQGKIQVDYFDRRGYFHNSGVSQFSLFKGGTIDIVPLGTTGSQVMLNFATWISGGTGTESSMFLQDPTRAPHTRLYRNATGTRGWVKITYAGTANGVPQPFAIKSKFRPIGPWGIFNNCCGDNFPPNWASGNQDSIKLPFNSLGVPANRLVYTSATILSDPNSQTGSLFVTNLHRNTHLNQIGGDQQLSTVDDSANAIGLVATASTNKAVPTFYSSFHSSTTVNRGWYRVDYLAAACNEGSGFYKVFFAANASSDDCAGNNGAIHVIQTKGNDIWSTADQCAFVYKQYGVNQTPNLTMIARVDNQEKTSDWAKAGLMMRQYITSTSAEVSILVTPVNGVQMTYRASDVSPNNQTFHPYVNTALKAPIYIRLVKTGNSYTGSTSPTGLAGSWTQLGSPINNVTLPAGSSYYVGLASTSSSSELNTTVFSNASF